MPERDDSRRVEQVIILGGHIQALGLARQVRAMGIRVILFIEDACSVARYSRSVSETVVFGSIDRLEAALIPYHHTKSLLFPTGDQYVEFIAKNNQALADCFALGIPQTENVDLFGDKRKTYQFASKMGIPHPKSWYPNDMEDVETIACEAAFPLVVKPAVMYSFHKLFGKKAFRCDDKEALLQRCKRIQERIPLSSVIIQEYLAGGAKSLYSYGCFSVDGEPKAWIMANRIRQNPMDFGNSTTFAISCHVPQIEESARKILRTTHYSGLAEIEFMYDEPTGTFKFLEINTRAWKWHSISTGLGFGFLSDMVKYLNGQPMDFQASSRSIAWVERVTDWAIIVKESFKGRMDLWEALKTYRRKKVSAVWSWKDPLPALMYVILSPILFVKRY